MAITAGSSISVNARASAVPGFVRGFRRGSLPHRRIFRPSRPRIRGRFIAPIPGRRFESARDSPGAASAWRVLPPQRGPGAGERRSCQTRDGGACPMTDALPSLARELGRRTGAGTPGGVPGGAVPATASGI